MAIPTKDELEQLRVSALKEPVAPATEGITEDTTKATLTDVVVTDDKVPVPVELSDDEIFALAEKRGMKVSRETLTPEQQKKAADIEEAQKLQFAIEQNLITSEGYQEAKNILASEGADLTKKEFAKAYKEENKGATKEDIDSAYDDYYFVQKNVKETKVKRDEKGKVVPKGDDYEDIEMEETEKPKWDERILKLGEFRRNQDTNNIKNRAKSTLENIDNSYANYKTVVSRATDYSKNIEKVIAETDFAAYPTSHKIKDKEISAKVKFEKPDEVKAAVQNFLNKDMAQLFLQSEKHNDVVEIKKQVDKFIKDKYSRQFEETLWELAETSGINKAKVGSSAPIERELISDDSRVDELAKDVEARIPQLPPKLDTNKR